MKQIFTTLCLLLPFLGFAQNYFQEGTIWKELAWSDATAEPTYYEITIKLEASASNPELLSLTEYYDGQFEPRFIGYIKSEGEKVFIKQNDQPTSEWYLIYDFGLQPGEGCDIFGTYFYDNGVPHVTYMEYI